MKKLFMTVLLAASAATITAQALPIGNPGEASLLIDGILWEGANGDPCDPCSTWCDTVSVRLGFYGDCVLDRYLEAKANNGIVAPSTTNVTVKEDLLSSHIDTNAGFIALGLWDRLDLFGTVGVTSMSLRGTGRAFSLSDGYDSAVAPAVFDGVVQEIFTNSTVEVLTDSGFAWSVGTRGTLWECGCATLGAELQYARGKADITDVIVDSPAAAAVFKKPTASASIKEWQVGAGLSYRINMMVPYIGIKWSKASVKMKDTVLWNLMPGADIFPQTDSLTAAPVAPAVFPLGPADSTRVGLTLNPMSSRSSFGFAIGTTIVDADKMSLTIEGRFMDERAIHINGQVRF